MDTASSITDWIAALGGLAGFIALAMEVFFRGRSRKRPPGGLLDSLQGLIQELGEIAAEGGKEAFWFLEPSRQREVRLLAVLNGQIVDDELNRLVGDARAGFDEAFACAPGEGTLRLDANVRRVERQVQAVEKAQTACIRAIDRANGLLRKYSP